MGLHVHRRKRRFIGAGLLEITGLEKDTTPTPDVEEANASTESGEATSWWGRYREYRARQNRRPHAPGVWIVYFSLAALPLFGLGQALIPAAETSSRRYAFWLMGIYVASALGLLLTTSFLGLRRYLRQRKLQMPWAMTGVWLGIGTALIVLLLLVSAFLPRPNAEYALVRFSKVGSKERDASKYSPGGGESGKGEGRSGSQGADEGEGNASGKGSESGGKGQGEGKSGGGKGKEGQGGGEEGQNREGAEAGKQPGKGGDQSTQKNPADGKNQNQSQNQNSKDGDQKGESDTSNGSSVGSTALGSLSQLFTGLSTLFKWIVFILVGLIVAFFVFRAILRFLSNFTGWAKGLLGALDRFWKSLFGWWQPTATRAAEEDAEEAALARRPFSSFANPFATGMSGSPEELVRYSFEA